MYQGAFSLIGRKGYDCRKVVQQLVSKNDVALVKQKLPILRMPLVYDSTRSSISSATDVLESLSGIFIAKRASTMEKVMLLSILGIITTNLSICSRGISDWSNQSVIDEPLKERIKLIVMSLIEKPQTDDAGKEISRSAVRLFITGLEILFPSERERCSTLFKYLEGYGRGILSDLEKSVLESLMRQMTNVRFLSKVLSKKVSASLNPNDLLKTLLTIVKRGIIVQFGAISLGTYSKSFGGIIDAAMKLLLMFSNVMFSARAQYLISSKGNIEEAKFIVGELLVQSKAVMETCLEIFDTALELNSKVGVSRDSRYIMNPFIEEILRQSPVCELLPLIADSLFMLAPRFISSFNQPLFFEFADNIRACLSAIAIFLSFAPKNFLFPPATFREKTDEVFVYESEHLYLPNTQFTNSLCIETPHWLIDLEQRLVNLLSGYAFYFVSSSSEFDEIESTVLLWLNSGFYKKDTPSSGPVAATSLDIDANKLLNGLLSTTSDPLATELSKIMRENVTEDRGNVEAIDIAVRGTCALLIKVCILFGIDSLYYNY